MDERDFRLLAALAADPTAPVASLCGPTGLSRSSVRARMDGLLTSGVLVGFYAFPNAAALGGHYVVAVYPPSERRPEPARVFSSPEALSYSVNHDGQVAVTLFCENPDQATPALDRALGGTPRRFVQSAPPMSPPGTVLSRSEWRVMEALVRDPRASHAQIARSTRLSAKVVRRVRARLVEGRAVKLEAGIATERAPGLVMYNLWVQGTHDLRAVRAALPGAMALDTVKDPPGLFVFCRAESVGDAVASQARVMKVPGVVHAELVLLNELVIDRDRLVALCRAAPARDGAPRR